MATKNEKNVENGEQNNVVNTPETQENKGAQNAEAPTEQKTEKLGWFKRHWKAVAAGIAAAVTVGGASVVAYKKGKQAGAMEMPINDDGSYGPEE